MQTDQSEVVEKAKEVESGMEKLFKVISRENETVTVPEQNWEAIKENYSLMVRHLQILSTEPDEIEVVEALGIVTEGEVVKVRVSKGEHSSQLVTILDELDFEKVAKIGQEVIVRKGTIIDYVPEDVKIPIIKPVFDYVQWNEIVGLDDQVDKVRRAVRHLKHGDRMRELGGKPRTGCLLYGPPGVGKTLIAKAIATEIFDHVEEVPAEAFMYYKGGEILNKYVGESERIIAEAFEKAREFMAKTNLPAIIFIDEAEAILPRRGSRQSSDVDSTIVPTFLSEMDGLHALKPFVILATNHREKIDSAVIRKGRVDLHVKIDHPSKENYMDLILHYIKDLNFDSEVQKEHVAARVVHKTFRSNVSNGADAATISQTIVAHAFDRIMLAEENTGDTIPSVITTDDVDSAIKEYLETT